MLHRYRRRRLSPSTVFGVFFRTNQYHSIRGYLGDVLEVSGRVRSVSLWFFNEAKSWKIDGQPELFQPAFADGVAYFYIYFSDIFASGSHVYFAGRYGFQTLSPRVAKLDHTAVLLLFKFTRTMRLIQVWKSEVFMPFGQVYVHYPDIFYEEFGSRGYEDRSGTISVYDLFASFEASVLELESKKLIRRGVSQVISPKVVEDTGFGSNRDIECVLTANEITEKSVLHHFDLPMTFRFRERHIPGSVSSPYLLEIDGEWAQIILCRRSYAGRL